jgi:Rrf2 family protein
LVLWQERAENACRENLLCPIIFLKKKNPNHDKRYLLTITFCTSLNNPAEAFGSQRNHRQLDSLLFYTILPIDEIGTVGFMKLTTRSEYGLLALVYLARHKDQGFISIETIAKAQGIPPKFLEQLMLALKRAHFLRSTKGQRGGYALSKEPDQITLAEVIRLFDGALAPTESVSENFYESTPIEKEKKLTKVFKDIRDYISQKLEKTTIADVMK